MLITKLFFMKILMIVNLQKKIQCEAYVAHVGFGKATKGDLFDLKIKRFGTVYSDKKEKTMPVDQDILYKFINGRYETISQKGERYDPIRIDQLTSCPWKPELPSLIN